MYPEVLELLERVQDLPDDRTLSETEQALRDLFIEKFEKLRELMRKMQDILNNAGSCFEDQFPGVRERFNNVAERTGWSAENGYDGYD